MTLDETNVLIALIRESASLFVLLVFIVLSYRLLDKFCTLFLEVMQEISDNISDIGDK
jgi:hypothetical protein